MITPYGRPGTPNAPAASVIPSGVLVSYGAPDANGKPISQYVVRAWATNGQLSATVASTTTKATFTGLVPGTRYTFTVTAINAAGWGAESTHSAAVTAPTPSDLRAVVPDRVFDTRRVWVGFTLARSGPGRSCG